MNSTNDFNFRPKLTYVHFEGHKVVFTLNAVSLKQNLKEPTCNFETKSQDRGKRLLHHRHRLRQRDIWSLNRGVTNLGYAAYERLLSRLKNISFVISFACLI